MAWVRETKIAEAHPCQLPMRVQSVRLPSGSLNPDVEIGPAYEYEEPAGAFGDLWRCDGCRKLWRVGNGCGSCDPGPPAGRCRRGGYHPASLEWRPASWWQRLRHRSAEGGTSNV